MSLAIISADTIQDKLSEISRSVGVVLRYRVVERSGSNGTPVSLHTVARAHGKKWVDITDPVKTQRVLWKRVTVWDELSKAVKATKEAK